MLDFLKNYVLVIAGGVIITSIIMPVVSDKNIKATLRFAIGTVLCLMLITPLAGLGGITIPDLDVQTADARTQGEFDALVQRQIDAQFAEKVKTLILDFLEKKGAARDVFVSVKAEQGKITEITLAEGCIQYKREIAAMLGVDSALIKRQEEVG